MLQGTLVLLTIVSLAQVWGRSWSPAGEEGGHDRWDLVRHHGALEYDRDMIRENKVIRKLINIIPQGATLGSLRRPVKLRSPIKPWNIVIAASVALQNLLVYRHKGLYFYNIR